MAGVQFPRKYVSRWVPSNPRAITALMVGVAVVNSATLGYDSSMMNGLNILPQYKDYFHLTTATTGLNNSATWMGGMLSCFILQQVADTWGRKFGILLAACVCIVGTIIQSASQNIATFVIGRIFIGFGSGLAVGSAPTLISEILPATKRGSTLGLFFSCFFVGSLLSSGINYRVVNVSGTWAWRIPSIIQAFPSLLALSCLPLVPESPRWLIAKGRREEATEVIAVITASLPTDERTTLAVTRIENVLRREAELYPGNPWKELISTKGNRRRIFIVASFGVTIELYGNFVISYYLGAMLTQAGITDPTTQLQINIILNCWSFAVACAGSLLTDVIGRRIQALTGISGMIVMLYLFGGLAKVYGTGSDNNSGIYGTIAVLFLFQGFYAFSITPLTSLYATEVLHFKIRNAGRAVFTFLDNGFGLMASFAMSYAMADLGWKFYFINASWDIVFLLIVYFFWVETARVPLEEISMKFGDLHYEDFEGQDPGNPVEQIETELTGKAVEKS